MSFAMEEACQIATNPEPLAAEFVLTVSVSPLTSPIFRGSSPRSGRQRPMEER